MLEREDAIGEAGRGSCAARVCRWVLRKNRSVTIWLRLVYHTLFPLREEFGTHHFRIYAPA